MTHRLKSAGDDAAVYCMPSFDEGFTFMLKTTWRFFWTRAITHWRTCSSLAFLGGSFALLSLFSAVLSFSICSLA